MRKAVLWITVIFLLLSLVQAASAFSPSVDISGTDELMTPDQAGDDYADLAWSVDITGIIIILLCVTGTALLIFFLMRIKYKNKNQIPD